MVSSKPVTNTTTDLQQIVVVESRLTSHVGIEVAAALNEVFAHVLSIRKARRLEQPQVISRSLGSACDHSSKAISISLRAAPKTPSKLFAMQS